jgi:hypothetical protein
MSIVGLGLVLAAAITPLSVANWPQTTVVDAGLLGADVGQYASMAVLPSGQPAISYFDAASRNLLYAQRDPNGTWAVTIVATAVGIPVGTANVYNSLAIVGGEPAISFYATNGAGALKYVRRTGVVWPVPESVDSGQLCGAYNSLAVLDPNDPNGNPGSSTPRRAPACGRRPPSIPTPSKASPASPSFLIQTTRARSGRQSATAVPAAT